MQSEFYPFQSVNNRLHFTFKSVSPNKTIQKIVLFTPIEDDSQIYNLALLDVMPDGEWSDVAKSHNFDLEKVMATVIQCIFEFLHARPNCSVYFKGNSPSKTRLYRIVMNKQLSTLKKYFELYGILNGVPELFDGRTNYEAFILKFVSHEEESDRI
jgi:hypothetical protein